MTVKCSTLDIYSKRPELRIVHATSQYFSGSAPLANPSHSGQERPRGRHSPSARPASVLPSPPPLGSFAPRYSPFYSRALKGHTTTQDRFCLPRHSLMPSTPASASLIIVSTSYPCNSQYRSPSTYVQVRGHTNAHLLCSLPHRCKAFPHVFLNLLYMLMSRIAP